MTFSERSVEQDSRRRAAPAAFAVQQFLLARRAPAPAAGRAVLAHHAVAGDDQRKAVRATGAADRARGLGCADRARNLAVAARFARGNPGQRTPHAPLERGGGDIQRWQRLATIAFSIELARDPRDG